LYSEIIQYEKNKRLAGIKLVLSENIVFSFHSKFVIPKTEATIAAEIEEIMIKSINHATNLSDHLAMRSSLNVSESASDMN
jgi:hypothetical protein